MTDTTAAGSGDDVSRLVESAQRLGIELDAADTERWLGAQGPEQRGLVLCVGQSVMGQRAP